jgi:hypothetical protein
LRIIAMLGAEICNATDVEINDRWSWGSWC